MMRGVVLAVVLAWAGVASAQRESKVDGNKLMSICAAHSPVGCDAYLAGVGDAVAAAGPAHAAACIPDAVTSTQLRDVVLKYLHAHPESREMKAGILVVRAYGEAFPCKK